MNRDTQYRQHLNEQFHRKTSCAVFALLLLFFILKFPAFPSENIPYTTGKAGERYVIENAFIRLAGQNGSFDSFQVDPKGSGNFGDNWIKSLQLGEIVFDYTPDLTWERTGTTIKVKNIPIAMPAIQDIGKREHAFPLWQGQRLGQRFKVTADFFTGISGFFPTWNDTTSDFTLTLRRDNPEGEVVASKRLIDVTDASEQKLTFAPQRPGFYYLEMSKPSGSPGWWFSDGRISKDETSFITGPVGDESVDQTFQMRVYGYTKHAANLEVELCDNRIHLKLTAPKGIHPRLLTAWIRDGYVTDNPEHIPFKYVLNDSGIYNPVHQFKRRERHEMGYKAWLEMTGSRNFNIRFLFSEPGVLSWRMASDTMSWNFNNNELEIGVVPYCDELPDTFPVFFTSDKKFDGILNQFLYSHAFNFGSPSPPDWCEWLTRIFCWTPHPKRDEQAYFVLEGHVLRGDGYVHTWGGNEGWPFPFEDKDGDGKNDYDTRHFATNACFILGAANLALWSRDKAFLETALPRVRKAMEYQLSVLQGNRGIIVIDAKGHEGKDGGLGSNYWDILPFGYKDAFCNSYYYASLEAMARIEKLAAEMGLQEAGHTPEFYRNLRTKVYEAYQQAFWDENVGRFVGCIDVDGVSHDYGFTFVNTQAMAYGLADAEQVKRIYHWMEAEANASGKKDTYSRWIFGPRSSTIYNPPTGIYNMPETITKMVMQPGWWHSGWRATPYEEQCQAGGAILYTSYYDIMTRIEYLGIDNAFKRFRSILRRYAMPDHLSGGSPLYRGETSQGHGAAGAVGVESEFPESGLVPVSFLYAFMGVDADSEGLKIRPQLPRALKYAGVHNLCYAGKRWEIKVSNHSVIVKCLEPDSSLFFYKDLTKGETFCLNPALFQQN